MGCLYLPSSPTLFWLLPQPGQKYCATPNTMNVISRLMTWSTSKQRRATTRPYSSFVLVTHRCVCPWIRTVCFMEVLAHHHHVANKIIGSIPRPSFPYHGLKCFLVLFLLGSKGRFWKIFYWVHYTTNTYQYNTTTVARYCSAFKNHSGRHPRKNGCSKKYTANVLSQHSTKYFPLSLICEELDEGRRGRHREQHSPQELRSPDKGEGTRATGAP